MSGFQSSKEVSKSSANLRQRFENFPLLTKEPELQAKTKTCFNIVTIEARS